ncbi:MAG TPA: PVC-type heme-binding CxxCH protein, partial [Isosphaeraceae bacterium]
MSRSTMRALALAFAWLAPDIHAAGQNVLPHRQDRPPNRPYTPEEALERMTVPPGFTVELVAAEPDLVNPIAMTFDDRGRIWVTESLEYPRKEPGPGRDRVRILEDTDGDGRADKIARFAGGLNIPTGIAVGHGGVWVLNAPDLLFLRDRDGDDQADQTEVVLTGFGRADTHELPSTLTWGPDGWLYGLNGVFNPSKIASGGKVHEFTCAMWRVHPRTRAFEIVCEGTSNPYGLAWDPEGSAIVEACHWAKDHLFHFVETGYYKRQAGAYPPFATRIGAISDHGHRKTAYCGLTYLDSPAYPEAYRDRLYTGNIHGGCINADRLTRDGSTYFARAEPDFLQANDAWFMPVAQKVGPDGCLYILDWYDRYHCYQDANRDPEGIDRLKGRLYRVRYRDSPRAPRFDLATEDDEALVQRLASPNIYFRESAQRLLTERNTVSVRERLERLVLDASAPRKARLHGLWALIGAGRLEPTFLARLLDDADPAYRAWGVRSAGNARTVVPTLRDRIAGMVDDASPDVLLQLAIAARKIEGLDALPLLIGILSRCGEDKLIPAVVWQNLHPLLPVQSDRFARLTAAVDLKTAPALAVLLPRAVDRLLGEPDADPEPVRAILGRLVGQDAGRAQECLAVIADRAREMTEVRREALRGRLEPILGALTADPSTGSLGLSARLLASRLGAAPREIAAVRGQFLAAELPESLRLQALDALVAFEDPGLPEAVGIVLASGSPGFLTRVLSGLGRADDPRLAEVVLAAY